MDTFDASAVVPKETLVRLRAIFDRMCGQNGRLDACGLKSVFDMLGANFSESDVMDLVVEADPHNKALDFTDFLTMMRRPLDDNVLDDLRDAFATFDRKGRGYLEAHDLSAAMADVINTPVSALTVRTARSHSAHTRPLMHHPHPHALRDAGGGDPRRVLRGRGRRGAWRCKTGP